MKRKFIALALAAMTTAAVWAVPAKRITKTIVQPDGSTVEVTLQGDEWFHSYVTSDNLAVWITDDGYAVYVTTAGPTTDLAHNPADRSAAEQSAIASNRNNMTFSALRAEAPKYQARMEELREEALARAEAAGQDVSAYRRVSSTTGEDGIPRVSLEQGESQVPHKGTAKVPILLANFSNVSFKNASSANETFHEFFMGTDNLSCHKYFSDASNGLYDPQFDVYGPFTLPNTRKYYGGSNSNGSDEKPDYMVRDAIQLADPTVDFSQYDNDGDGVVDVVIVLYAGVGQASSGLAESVWPCQWSFSSARMTKPTVDGVKCDKFAVFNELNGSHQTQIDGPGTFCHEFSHCLGLPDFYETTYYYGYMGMDVWSLMDYGCYNDDGYTPIGYTAYEKAFMGWITLLEGQSNKKYDLPVLNKEGEQNTDAVILINPKDKNEYFIFEARDQQGWDEYIYDRGMLITHVTYSASAWNANTVNNQALQRMTIVPADNKFTEATRNADLWPKSYAYEFTSTSVPANVTNSSTTSTKYYLNHDLTEITRDATTGTVSFWIDRAPVSPVEPPVIDEEENKPIFEEPNSFTASWGAVEVEGTDVSYTLQVWEKTDGLTEPSVWQDFTIDTPITWSESGEVKKQKNYVQLGNTSGTTGAITSPCAAIADDGYVTVVAYAKRFGTDSNAELKLSIIDASGNNVAFQTFPLGSIKEYCKAKLKGEAGKTYAVRIENLGTSRVMAYNVMAFDGDCTDYTDAEFQAALDAVTGTASAPAHATVTTSASGRITISGIRETSYKVTGLTNPEGTYCYRIKVVPDDETVGQESFWSNTMEVSLADAGVADIIAAPSTNFTIANGTILATPGARLYTMSGLEIPATSNGQFAVAPGAYILATPGCHPAKVLVK